MLDEVYYVEDLNVGDIVVYSEETHMGFVYQIDTNLDDNDEEYLYATVRWFDGFSDTTYDNSELADSCLRVIRS